MADAGPKKLPIEKESCVESETGIFNKMVIYETMKHLTMLCLEEKIF